MAKGKNFEEDLYQEVFDPRRKNGRRVLERGEFYLREVWGVPFLSREEEQELGKQIERCHQFFLSSLWEYEDEIKGLELLAEQLESKVVKPGGNGKISKESYKEFKELEQRLGASREPKEGEGRWAYLSQVDELYNNLFEMFCYRLPRNFSREAARQLYQRWEGRSEEGGKEEKEESKRSKRELGKKIKEEARATEKLIYSHLGLVVKCAREFYNSLEGAWRGEMDKFDLIQCGNIGLIKAADRFDYRQGNWFSTYAVWLIRQSMRRAWMEHSQTVRIPIHLMEKRGRYYKGYLSLWNKLRREPTGEEMAEETELPLRVLREIRRLPQKKICLSFLAEEEGEEDSERIIPHLTPDEIEEGYNWLLLRAGLEKGDGRLSLLSGRERQVLEMRFGLGGEDDYTQKEVGERLGLTGVRIGQIEEKALEKLRKRYTHRHK